MKNGGVPTLFLDIASLVRMEGERGLLSMAFAPDYGASGRFYVYYTSNAVAGHALGDLVIAEYTVSADPDVANPIRTDCALDPTPARQPQRRPAAIRAGRLPLHRDRRRRRCWRPGPRGQSLGHAARQAPADRPARLGRRAVHNARRQSIRRARAVRAREIWAYGLRNPWRFSFDRQTGDLDGRGRRAERVGGDRLRPGRRRPWPGGRTSAGAVGRGGTPTRTRRSLECSPARARRDPCTSTRTHVAVRSRGGYVVRDPTVPQLVGRYVYGDYCTSPVWSIALQIPDGVGDTDTGLDLGSTYSFGEDACGRVYVASGGGEVRRLQIEGAAAPAACAASAPPTPPHRLPVGVLLRHRHRLRRSRRRSVACLGSSACASSPHGADSTGEMPGRTDQTHLLRPPAGHHHLAVTSPSQQADPRDACPLHGEPRPALELGRCRSSRPEQSPSSSPTSSGRRGCCPSSATSTRTCSPSITGGSGTRSAGTGASRWARKGTRSRSFSRAPGAPSRRLPTPSARWPRGP